MNYFGLFPNNECQITKFGVLFVWQKVRAFAAEMIFTMRKGLKETMITLQPTVHHILTDDHSTTTFTLRANVEI